MLGLLILVSLIPSISFSKMSALLHMEIRTAIGLIDINLSFICQRDNYDFTLALLKITKKHKVPLKQVKKMARKAFNNRRQYLKKLGVVRTRNNQS